MSQLRIRVLGRIGAEIDGEPLHLSKSRHREILSILVAAHGRTVSTGRLVDELWEDAPVGAVGAVRTFIGELRRILEPERLPRTPPENLVTVADGYALKLTSTAVDLWRAEQAVQTAKGSSPAAREPLLTGALEEWRGTAFEEFITRPWAKSERAWIAELRAGAVEDLAEARLALGQPKDVVALLDAHIVEHPWREEGWRLLALALYRSARPGDALAVVSQARSTLMQDLGIDPSDRLAGLEQGIMRRDPALDLADDGGSILLRTATARTGVRSQLESVTVLLPLLAVSGSVQFAADQRMSAIAAAEQFGDPELAARVIGGFDVPGSWTRSAAIVDAALRTISILPAGASDRVRARLLATVAMESRGTANRLTEAAEAERIARRLGDPSLLCFALSARYVQTFEKAGHARSRETIGAELIALAVAAELPTFEIQGRLITMQALCALENILAASDEAAKIDALAARFDRPLASVFTAWFRWVFTQGPPPPEGSEMPGFRIGLHDLAKFTAAVRAGAELQDGHFGPYEPWVRPLLLARTGRQKEAAMALDSLEVPPHDLMLEVSWFLIGLAAIASGNKDAGRRSYHALLPAAGERAGGSGAVDLGPISPLLNELVQFCAMGDQY
ncbi:DNA-binding transcriptional activator of the SARP family [Arthrobacter alpinus]|uniref:DNA-binding transcriptional activator of the SARP family n=1 Tax=Arthrobacter alpinus TaxID=656366 RepID=A0A1H5I890_9MICC|nr:BTAD domain-containing putative transcriptional regulator [Arthrobacter alpinus]SEE36339.1 DNA-binding transcriptional activator of the SARP family [Arthrobacter alpinus]